MSGEKRKKPCPFCGRNAAHYAVDPWGKTFYVCESCGACGPDVDGDGRGANLRALAAWNRRAGDAE